MKVYHFVSLNQSPHPLGYLLNDGYGPVRQEDGTVSHGFGHFFFDQANGLPDSGDVPIEFVFDEREISQYQLPQLPGTTLRCWFIPTEFVLKHLVSMN